jgi:hypothetical protein
VGIPENDTYRALVYGLPLEELVARWRDSLHPSDIPKDLHNPRAKPNALDILKHDGWPLKAMEGDLSLARGSAGNPDVRWLASWNREIYGASGWANDRTMRDAAEGPDELTAILRLWLLCVEAMFREDDTGTMPRWADYHFSMMRRVAASVPPAPGEEEQT